MYEQLLPYCCEAEVTRNHCLRNSDTYFPNLDEDPAWVVVSRSEMQQVAEGEGDAGVFLMSSPRTDVVMERAGSSGVQFSSYVSSP